MLPNGSVIFHREPMQELTANMYSSRAAETDSMPGYPRSELLALLPAINPFMTPVFPASNHLDPLGETGTQAPERISQRRLLSDSQWFGRWLKRFTERFRQRSH